MAYADHSQTSSRTVSFVIVALIHAVLGYAFVTGLGMKYVKKAAEQLKVIDVKEEPPPPPDEPPPPPPKPQDLPPPPPVVAPPSIVKTITAAPPISSVPVAPPPVFTTPAPPPPPPPPGKAERAAPKGRPGEWVTTDDYPARALREERQGVTGFRLDVGADGKVTNCTVTSSSGSPELDETACRLLARRARFKPAVGTDGQPLADTYTSRIVWRIPQ